MNPPEAQAAAMPETVIAPPRRWNWRIGSELWQHRELVYFLTKRELQIRYKQSFFGVSWAVLQPLVLAFIFAVLFGVVLDLPSEGIAYPVFVVAGVVPWLFTAQAITMGANSLVADADLISKVYFPRMALPIAKALSLVADLVIAFAVVIAVALLYGVGIASTFYLLPAFVLLGVVTTFALSALLAAINVKYRDVQLVMPMLVQVLLFASPVFYSGSLVTEELGSFWGHLYAINPMVSVLDGVRWALFGAAYPGDGVIAVSVGSALVLLLVAISYFQRTERYFADVV